MKGKIILMLVLTTLLLNGCASTPMNDFFGIQMNPDEEKDFKIYSYSDFEGVKYSSNINMNPNVYAWAEFDLTAIRIKVLNNSGKNIPISYINDNFLLQTKDGEAYALTKEEIFNYTKITSLEPGASVEFKLEVPSRFWDSIGKRNVQMQGKEVFSQFDKNENSLSIIKENVKSIYIQFGGEVNIVLKAVPADSIE
ncbi:MAG: hypothetical protein KJ799_07970 [Bacteroidetes bacterium]|nr:hypothetical protein [Bacteroidota bacterium]MBU1677564.1 hypothetical protein [Bacteroidota bacterium]MBU2506645.1 hypothetical protein [Bacteroidota bacterium]